MAQRIQLRGDTQANWELVNPTLAINEIGIDITNNKIKIGDGSNAWDTLPYFAPTGDVDIGGAITPGDGISFTGSGTIADPYVVNQDGLMSSLAGYIEAGANVTFTGAGTLADPYIVEVTGLLSDITGYIEAGSGVTITGSGTLADPYTISASGFLTNITGLITAGTNVTITGSGTSGSPYVINASGGGGPAVWELVGSNTTEASTTSASAVDVMTVSGLSIATTDLIKVIYAARITSAGYGALGLKMNSTVVGEAAITGGGGTALGEMNSSQPYMFGEILLGKRITNYNGIGSGTGLRGTETGYNTNTDLAPVTTAAQPNATITSLAIRGKCQSGATLYVGYMHVYKLATA